VSAAEVRTRPAVVTLGDESVAYLGLAVETADCVTLEGWRRIRIGHRFVFPQQGKWSWPRATAQVTWLTESEWIAA